MAKIGLKYLVYKTDTTQGIIGKAIQADVSITTNNVKLYAEDAVSETDASFREGTFTVGIDDLSDIVQVDLLGHVATDGEITSGGGDVAPYASVGFYAVKRLNNVDKYRAIWLRRVQFAEPSDKNATKGEEVSFSTPTIEGTIMLDDNGKWKDEKTFNTYQEAVAYLQAKSGVKNQCTKPVADLVSGTYEGTQSVTLAAGTGEEIRYTTNGTTPSPTNGTVYSTAISVPTSSGIRAIATKAGMNDSEVANYEYIITA